MSVSLKALVYLFNDQYDGDNDDVDYWSHIGKDDDDEVDDDGDDGEDCNDDVDHWSHIGKEVCKNRCLERVGARKKPCLGVTQEG